LLQLRAKESSLLLLPAQTWSLDLISLEAISTGTPLLVNGKSAYAELIKKFLPGGPQDLLLPDPHEEPVTWRSGIQTILHDRGTACIRARALYEKLQSHLSWEGSVTRLLMHLS